VLKTLCWLTILALAVVLLVWGSSLSAFALADSQPEGNSNPSLGRIVDWAEILVQFKPGISASTIAEVHCQNGGRVVDVIPQIGVQVVEVPSSQLEEKLAAYLSCPSVEYAEPNSQGQIMAIPDDSGFGGQWNMSQVQAPEAWDVSHGSSTVDIAILDTGIDQDHPDLSSKIVANVNFSSSPSCDDYYRHGTHVAGIAAAVTDNGIGVAGMGYNSSLMNVKVFNDDGSANASALAQGIIWAADNGAEVININMIYGYPSTTLENAVNYAWEKGAVLVAAAGNYGNTRATYPGAFANCIAVAATDADDNLASWSTYGDWVSVAAPGVSIYSTLPDGYGYGSGTCMASPLVSGLAALLFTVVTDTNGDGRLNDEVRYAIESTCDDIGTKVAYGRINAYRAMMASVSSLGSTSGTVIDAQTSQPIEGATIGCGARQAKTDSSGSYIIAGVPEGSCTVTVSAPGYHGASQGVSVAAGATSTADFALTPLPRADFWGTPLSGSEPLTVSFSDSSTSYDGITSWRWDFGDGGTSSEQNPTHTYTREGVYAVSLTVTEADGDSDTETKVDYITVSDTRPRADFWGTPLSGGEPLTVSFSDSSTSYDGITSWRWDFGDGGTSTEQDPTHTYIQEGVYAVSLTVTEADGDSDTETKVDYITVSDTCPRADFWGTPLSGSEPLTVGFSDSSASYDGITSWRWDFGDGGTSSEQDPTHTYIQEGVYAVSLTVTEADGDSDTETKVDYITVSDTRPRADFWGTPLSGSEPLTVSFSDSSASYDGITSWRWDFGDGGTSSEQNPTHSYTAEGTYTVSLTVSDGADSDIETKIGYISVTKAPAEQNVPPTSKAIIETPDGRISLEFPPDALADETEVLIKQESVASACPTPSTFKPGATCFSIELTGELAPGATTTITVRYTDADLAAAGGDPNLLALSRYDEAAGQWVVIPTILDAQTKTLTAATDKFSEWMVVAMPSVSSSPPIMGILLGGLVLFVGSGSGYFVWRSRKAPKCQEQAMEEEDITG
jgi:thermitase